MPCRCSASVCSPWSASSRAQTSSRPRQLPPPLLGKSPHHRKFQLVLASPFRHTHTHNSAIPLKDRVLSSDLLLHGDPYDWLRRGGANGHKNGREGALFLVPKRALQQILAAEGDNGAGDNAAAAAPDGEGAPDEREQGSAALATAASSSSALALLERGEGYRVTLPGLLTQAQSQSGGGAGAAFGNAPPPELLAQTAPPGESGGGGRGLDPERLER